MNDSITSRYRKVFEEVNTLASQRDWQKGKIKLIVVTKRHNIDACIEVISAGATNFGENYVEEAIAKFGDLITGTLDIHLIGHLQSRKIKYLYPLFSTIQTLDSVQLSEKINQLYKEKEAIIKTLVEINLTNEATKSGFMLNNSLETDNFLRSFEKMIMMPNLQIIGLMTMGFYPENVETNRMIFRRARELLMKLKENYNLHEFDELSMGTSGDYQTAIQEGATMVRIGEKIMGSREYMEKK
jgi:PLP dependent protein